jgi:hypothetical protein
MNRFEMIKKLTKNELIYLQENPERLDDVVEFFTNGGHAKASDYELEKLCTWYGFFPETEND